MCWFSYYELTPPPPHTFLQNQFCNSSKSDGKLGCGGGGGEGGVGAEKAFTATNEFGEESENSGNGVLETLEIETHSFYLGLAAGITE